MPVENAAFGSTVANGEPEHIKCDCTEALGRVKMKLKSNLDSKMNESTERCFSLRPDPLQAFKISNCAAGMPQTRRIHSPPPVFGMG